MITLPVTEVQTRAALRVLIAEKWGKNSATSGDWELLPMARIGNDGKSMVDGYRVIGSISRHAFPMIGEATFCFDYGLFAHGILGATSAADVDTPGDIDLPALRDLTGYEVRIQAAPRTDMAIWPTTGWRTIWWGQVEYQTEAGDAAGSYPAGRRIYHCADGFQRTRYWPLTRHGIYVNGPDSQAAQFPAAGTKSDGVEGFPGYNHQANACASTTGNRDSSGATYERADTLVPMFATPGGTNAATWSDLQAVNHAMLAARPQLEPVFAMAGTTSLLSGASVWPVGDHESALSVAHRILDRKRGRGMAFVDWDDDSGAPTGPLTVKVTIRPQLLDDLTVTMPSGATPVVIDGATTAASYVTVDLIGDHRAVPGGTVLAERYQNQVGYLETVGERIEVAITGRVGDGGSMTAPNSGWALAPGWTTAQKTTFDALGLDDRADLKYAPIYTTFTLPLRWRGLAGDGNSGPSTSRVDYRCDDTGAIVWSPTGDPDTSPSSVEILSDLPFLEGYDYTADPAVRVGSEVLGTMPRRADPLVMVRAASDRYWPCDAENQLAASLKIDPQNITVTFSGDQAGGVRTVGDDSVSSLGSDFDYTELTITFAIRLPHRLRFASGDATARRRKRIEIQDAHLWLAPPTTIWGLTTTAEPPYAPKRQALAYTVTPARIRDDRDRVAILHALAWRWYGDAFPRTTGRWALRCCGMLSSFSAIRGDASNPRATAEDITYPRLGQLVMVLSTNGQAIDCNAPITSVVYDVDDDVTAWTMDWQDLDYV